MFLIYFQVILQKSLSKAYLANNLGYFTVFKAINYVNNGCCETVIDKLEGRKG